jgi:hypothetical protein
MILATMIMIMMCVVIQMMPTKNKGLSSMAPRFICVPMVATKMYKNTVPTFEAP